MSDNETEIAELRRKVSRLTEENKRLKCRLKSLSDDYTGNSLYKLKTLVSNYCESLGGDALIVSIQDDEYKLGVSLTECSIKDLKDWKKSAYGCSSLKGFEDNTKVLLID